MKLVFLFFCLPLCKHCMLIFHCLGRNAEKGYVFSSSSHSWFCISLHSEMGCRGVRGECGEKHTRDESFLVTSLSLHLSLSLSLHLSLSLSLSHSLSLPQSISLSPPSLPLSLSLSPSLSLSLSLYYIVSSSELSPFGQYSIHSGPKKKQQKRHMEKQNTHRYRLHARAAVHKHCDFSGKRGRLSLQSNYPAKNLYKQINSTAKTARRNFFTEANRSLAI